MIKFAERLKEIRIAKGVSQLQLANFMNVMQQTISSWEMKKREPSYNDLEKLCQYFDVTADYLLGITEY